MEIAQHNLNDVQHFMGDKTKRFDPWSEKIIDGLTRELDNLRPLTSEKASNSMQLLDFNVGYDVDINHNVTLNRGIAFAELVYFSKEKQSVTIARCMNDGSLYFKYEDK